MIGCGLILGKIAVRGISLGSSGVIFAGLLAGHWGYQVAPEAGLAGVVLFIYCLGIGAGPSFLQMFLNRGKALALLAGVMMSAALLAVLLMGRLFKLSPDLASGLFAGALTSTPALAAATEKLPAGSDVAVGFGIAYPFGVIGVILFIQILPRWFPGGIEHALNESTAARGDIIREVVEVQNRNLVGKRLRDVTILAKSNCQVSRLIVEGQPRPIPKEFQLELGQLLLVIGRTGQIETVIEALGTRCPDAQYVLDVERQRRNIVITSKEVVGRTLKDLHFRSRFGVTIARITRQNIEFVPGSEQTLHYGDILRAVGEPEDLERFATAVGHRARTADETDLIILAGGLILGMILGRLSLSLGGQSFSLGMAGGPLLVGLLLGHFGQFGGLSVRMPRAGRLLLGELGLTVFLAQAGCQAGGNFVEVVRANGLTMCLAAAVVVVVPLLSGFLAARYWLRLNLLETAGGLCGAMTSTPGLGAVTSAIDSSVPATSYATVYPVALVLVTLLAPILIALL
ncbi:aspartate:alanine exchanger family transporter [Gimesia chilikensis]|uniref:Aspartate/alanine antiporter n=1 Tax=Gimesia chilikensis TaxID=2605989 RepID=A0A517PJQ3_9PLAN|nr:TrkA C-terminal domain-containing protein [Gimesia chilikensis]QDT19551.1 Aspartate/alanine antiporter [Gimesia chilikensis]